MMKYVRRTSLPQQQVSDDIQNIYIQTASGMLKSNEDLRHLLLLREWRWFSINFQWVSWAFRMQKKYQREAKWINSNYLAFVSIPRGKYKYLLLQHLVRRRSSRTTIQFLIPHCIFVYFSCNNKSLTCAYFETLWKINRSIVN